MRQTEAQPRRSEYPRRSYHGFLPLSREANIDAPPRAKLIAFLLERFLARNRVEDRRPEPFRIIFRDAKRSSKQARFVSSAAMRGVEAIVRQFADIEDRRFGVRQARHS